MTAPTPGDALQQCAVGLQRRRGGDQFVGLALEAVGLLPQEGDGAGDGLPRGAGQAGSGEAPLLAGR